MLCLTWTKSKASININTDLNAYSTDGEGNLYFIADTLLCRYHASYNVSQLPKIMIDGVKLF